jgi:chemotaxis methyl-accepting protein methylase
MEPANGTPRPELSALEVALFGDAIEKRCGIEVTESRVRFLTRCLWSRLRACGMRSYSEYYHRLAYGADGGAEWGELLELLLNRETGFFRHLPSFEALAGRALPELIAERSRHGVAALTAWSAGCATGEEAWSLAMALLEAVGAAGPGRWGVKVAATDLSETALSRARRGRYRAAATRSLPAAYRERYLERVEEDLELYYQPDRRLRPVVEFGRLNLNRPEEFWVGAQDVIFCQNVLVYFRAARREEIARELCRKLKPWGYLFLAPGEVVGLRMPGIRAVRFDNSLAYQRTP